MHFEKALRRQQLLPEPIGHAEADSKRNQGEPIMQTVHRRGKAATTIVQSAQWPQEIILQLSWQAIPLPVLTTKVQSLVPDYTFASTQMYLEHATDAKHLAQNACAAVEISFERIISVSEPGLQSLQFPLYLGDVLLHHAFLLQQAGTLTLRRRPLGDGDWLVTPPKMPELANINLLGLFGYAGFAKPGVRLQDLEQIFAHITQAGNETRLSLKPYSDLVSANIAPPYGGQTGRAKVVYLDSLDHFQNWSVAQAITASQLQFTLAGEGDQKTYYSLRIVDENPSNCSFTVAFA